MGYTSYMWVWHFENDPFGLKSMSFLTMPSTGKETGKSFPVLKNLRCLSKPKCSCFESCWPGGQLQVG